MAHTPVLLNEVLEYLNPRPGDVFIDATINGGGHAKAIAERIGKKGKLLGIDRDCELVEKFQVSDFQLICDTFANIQHIAEDHGFTDVDGIIFDLGFSSFHIEQSGRGFSFLRDEPLDMRFDSRKDIPARDIINKWPEHELRELLRTTGEERFGRSIARQIVRERDRVPIERTFQLVEIIRRAVPGRYRQGRIHFATRTFQALRMCVNDELKHVAQGVERAVWLLKPGGRIAVLSFHSGEDRIVKDIFRSLEQEDIVKRVIKKPVRAATEEMRNNLRARSAKLRVAERL
ncbi:MAG: 16S rRNA (cytosine1402-N4)-methyltransferase [Parcubacteria group bacterium Gr01-1014_29]|nr:MAG: 16S rRNA (cytosine1402-N4)-methyltransferase [Parcubacteria group bacterium Gr01-1014_29]